MARAAAFLGETAQARRRIKTNITLAREHTGVRMQEQVAVFGNKEKQQAVNQAQKLAIIVLLVERARE